LSHLNELRKGGHIRAIGLCNFDTIHTDEICTQLGPGVIVSNQVQVRSRFDFVPVSGLALTSPVQFSLVDTRPLHGMSDVCAKHGLKLLTYGTLVRGLALALFYYDRVLR
jgi:aryl-alcohol dehydrogenase-like predicted oxidoreductase